MSNHKRLRIGVLAGGYSISHTVGAFSKMGFSRVDDLIELAGVWCDNGNNEPNRYMKYLTNWEQIQRFQRQQIRRLGIPDNIVWDYTADPTWAADWASLQNAPIVGVFRRDDTEVLRSGKPMLNSIELFFNRQGIPDWFLTHKLPVRDRRGRVIGIIGVTQSYGFGSKVREPSFFCTRSASARPFS